LGGLEKDVQRMIEVTISRIIFYALIGALVGAAYFAALGLNVELYAGAGARSTALLVHLARLGGAVAALTLLARQGAAPLLAAFAGFLVIRTISVNRRRPALESIP
jgi:F1F0 ATPase subunit 2